MEPSQIPVEALQGVYTAFAYVTTGSVSTPCFSQQSRIRSFCSLNMLAPSQKELAQGKGSLYAVGPVLTLHSIK